MKRSKLILGTALMGIAFTAAAFTTTQAALTVQYIQKPGECKEIPEDPQCEPNQPVQCMALDGTTSYPVFQSRNPSNPNECETPLGKSQ